MTAGGTGAVRLNGPIPAIHRLTGGRFGAGPGERRYSARLLPGSGQRDALPGAACVKIVLQVAAQDIGQLTDICPLVTRALARLIRPLPAPSAGLLPRRLAT